MKMRIRIDNKLCNGCGECISACPHQALQLLNGKVVVVKEISCDEKERCLSVCKQKAIILEEKKKAYCEGDCCEDINESELYNWPVKLSQIELCNPCLNQADLLLAADCSAFAFGNFHEQLLKDRFLITLCPLQDPSWIEEKLVHLFETISFNSVSVVAMTSECCQSLLPLVHKAIDISKQDIQVHEFMISRYGELYD